MFLASFTHKILNIFRLNRTTRGKLISFFKHSKLEVQNDQIQMILSIICLRERTVNQAKVPYSKMVTLPMDIDIKEAIAIFKKSGHSRLPVYVEENGLQSFKGFVHAKYLLSFFETNSRQKFKLQQYIENITFVPTSQTLLSLLRQMRLSKQHLMLAVDEYGEVTGLITLEDILEEIVGEIYDEFDKEKSWIREIGYRTFEVYGHLPLHKINYKLAINLPEERFNTLSGFILHERNGDLAEKVKIQYGDTVITLQKVKDNQVITAHIHILPISK